MSKRQQQQQPTSIHQGSGTQQAQGPVTEDAGVAHAEQVGNGAVQDEAPGAQAAAEVGAQGSQGGRTQEDTEETLALDTAIEIASYESSFAFGPYGDALQLMLVALDDMSVAPRDRVRGDARAEAARDARAMLASAADKVAEEDPDWVQRVYQPAIDRFVQNVMTVAATENATDRAGADGASSLLDAVASLEAKAQSIESVLGAASASGIDVAKDILLPSLVEQEGIAVQFGPGKVVSCLLALRKAAESFGEIDELETGEGLDPAAIKESLEVANDALAGIMKATMLAAQGVAHHAGAAEMAAAFGKTASAYSSFATGVGAFVAALDIAALVVETVESGEFDADDLIRLTEDALTIAAFAAEMAGAATLASVLGGIVVAFAVSEKIIAGMEDLQGDIIQGFMLTDMQSFIDGLEPFLAAHDRAVAASAMAKCTNEAEWSAAYLRASDCIAAEMTSPAKALTKIMRSTRSTTLKRELLTTLTLHSGATEDGFVEAHRFAEELTEQVNEVVTNLEDLAREEAGMA